MKNDGNVYSYLHVHSCHQDYLFFIYYTDYWPSSVFHHPFLMLAYGIVSYIVRCSTIVGMLDNKVEQQPAQLPQR